MFGVLLGNTVHSCSIVIGSYFLGMAIGYFLSGKLQFRVPMRGYGICEVLTGLWALAVPTLIAIIPTILLAGAINNETSWISTVTRILFSMVVLLPATIPMGVTLPLIAATLGGGEVKDSKALTYAYGFNLLGALAGSVIATAYLLVHVGVSGTSFIGSAVALLCGCAALCISKFLPTPPQERSASRRLLEQRPAGNWQFLAGVSGFCTIALQVLYIRMFSLIFHNSVYTFAAVVVVFILALSLGGFLVSHFEKRYGTADKVISLLQILGISISCSMLLFLNHTNLNYFESGKGFYGYLAGVHGLVAIIIALPVTLSGMVLPLSWYWAGKEGSLSTASVGFLTGINTIASTVGSLTAAYILLPTIGLWAGFTVIAAIYVGSSVAVFWKQINSSGLIFAALAFSVCAASLAVTGKFDGTEAGETLLKRWESAYGWIDVVRFEKSGHMQLRQNIHYGLGSTGSLAMQRRQAHIPLLLHPNPEDVLFIGLATGTTAGGALDHPSVKRVSIVELVPDVAKGAHFFDKFSSNVMSDPKVKLVLNDGRHFLAAHSEPRFDVIVADLFVPWESHTGYLYTQEHYQATKARLSDNGIFCQWLPLWQIGSAEFHTIANTFASIFPHTTVWYGKLHENWTIVGLVGFATPGTVDLAEIQSRIASYNMQLVTDGKKDESWFQNLDDFMLFYAGEWIANKGVPLNTDDHPRIEFLAPISAWTKGARLRFDALADFHKDFLTRLPFESNIFKDMAVLRSFDPMQVRAHQSEMIRSE